MSGGRHSLSEPIAEVVASGFFDADWYLARYRDVAILEMPPVEHYLRIGALIGRAPGPRFDGARYLRDHGDVAVSGINPLLHYVRRGKREGRLVHAVERAAVGDPARHLHALADARLQGPPQRMFAGFDFDAQELFLESLSRVVPARERGPRASIVMPTHNRGGLIRRAIESVRAQQHQNWELLIVDDGSTDDTFKVIDSFASDPRIRLYRQDHKGVSAARNTGLAHASGDWIFYLDSDNRWSHGFLDAMLGYLEFTGRACGYSAIAVEDGDGKATGYRGEPFDWAQCLRGNYVDLNAFCHRRSLHADLGGFDESLRRMVDWDLILRYTKVVPPAYAPFLGCYYRDSNTDRSRISVSQPIAYRSVVQAKNRLERPTPEAVARALSLRIAIKIPAPFEKRLEWGDYHFAESLKSSLERLGHAVTIDFHGDWHSRPVNQDQVVVVLRGLTAYETRPGQVNILWNISHPDQVDYAEYASYDIVYVASLSYPALLSPIIGRPVHALLQCTDAGRFRYAAEGAGEGVLFVGNSRNEYRPIVRWAVDVGERDLQVHGTRWNQFIAGEFIVGENIDNRELGRHYAGARVVLNDHWESMRDFGFVSNRVFDVLAAGGRLVSDPVPAIGRIFGDAVVQVDSQRALATALEQVRRAPAGLPARSELAAEVARCHSFDARARTLCDDVLAHLGLPRVHAGDGAASGGETRPCIGLLMQRGRHGPTSSGYIRLLAPLTTDAAHARLKVRMLDGIDDPALASCDACIVQRVAVGTLDEADALGGRLESMGVPLFVDNDDAFCLLGPEHPEVGSYRAKDGAMRSLMARAAQVWFSTAALQQAYPEAGERGLIVGNALDPRLWRDYRRPRRSLASDGTLQLLYMGTPTHDADFLELLPTLDRLAAEHPGRFVLSVVGALKVPPAREWLRTITVPRGIGDYPRFARWLARQGPFDAGLAPLADTAFNACKSDIKFLDYSALGILSVIPDVPAYAGPARERALAHMVANTPEGWHAGLEALLCGRVDMEAIASAAERYLWQERSTTLGTLPGDILGALARYKEARA